MIWLRFLKTVELIDLYSEQYSSLSHYHRPQNKFKIFFVKKTEDTPKSSCQLPWLSMNLTCVCSCWSRKTAELFIFRWQREDEHFQFDLTFSKFHHLSGSSLMLLIEPVTGWLIWSCNHWQHFFISSYFKRSHSNMLQVDI